MLKQFVFYLHHDVHFYLHQIRFHYILGNDTK